MLSPLQLQPIFVLHLDEGWPNSLMLFWLVALLVLIWCASVKALWEILRLHELWVLAEGCALAAEASEGSAFDVNLLRLRVVVFFEVRNEGSFSHHGFLEILLHEGPHLLFDSKLDLLLDLLLPTVIHVHCSLGPRKLLRRWRLDAPDGDRHAVAGQIKSELLDVVGKWLVGLLLALLAVKMGSFGHLRGTAERAALHANIFLYQ